MILIQHFTKQCSKCNIVKNINEFRIRTDCNSLVAHCKPCNRIKNQEYYKNNSEKLKADATKYYKENKDILNLNKIKYREKNKETIFIKKKEYREKNKEHISLKMKKYREENLEQLKEKNKIRYELNKDEIIKKVHIYYLKNRTKILKRAHEYNKLPAVNAVRKFRDHKRRKIQNEGDVTSQQILELQQNAKTCYWCKCSLRGVIMHLDHYEPLSKGGRHTISNLVVSCQKCNHKKYAKDPIVFANSIGRLL